MTGDSRRNSQSSQPTLKIDLPSEDRAKGPGRGRGLSCRKGSADDYGILMFCKIGDELFQRSRWMPDYCGSRNDLQVLHRPPPPPYLSADLWWALCFHVFDCIVWQSSGAIPQPD